MANKIDIPNGWEVKKLGEVFDIQMCRRIYKDQTNSIAGIPFYKIGTMGKTADAFIDEQLFNTYKNKYNYPLNGETLITCSGTIGKCYQYNGEKAYYQDSNIVWLRTKNKYKINLNYIFIVVSNIKWNSVEKTTITRLYTPTLNKAKILLPPLAEQEKIAEILSLWDKAIEHTKELIAYKEKQKKGLMQNLLTGKKRLPGFTDKWKTVKLGEVFDIQMCRRIYKDQTNSIGGIPFYKIGTMGKIADAFIDEQLFNTYKNKYNYPLNGETLITCSGTIGKCYQYNGEKAYYQDSNIVWLRTKNKYKINLNYIFIVVSNIKWNSVEKTTITRLYTPTLKKAEIFLPPLDEQKAIADILCKADEEIELLNKQLDLYTEQKKGLMQNLLTGKVRVTV